MVYSGKQRKDFILKYIYRNGHVLVKDLAVEMAISEATVRRDLKIMADAQEVELIYGGATLKRNGDFAFRSENTRNVEAKRKVGELAAGLIRDGDQIFLDSGTTTFQMAGLLKGKRNLSVIANSIRLTEALSVIPDVNIIMLGGQYRVDRMDTIGPLAMEAMEQLRGYRAFIGADGVSMDFGLAASDIESSHLYRLVIRHARETILVVDHTKFEAPSLYKIVDWDAVSTVVTDSMPSPAWVEFLKGKNIGVVCGSGNQGSGFRVPEGAGPVDASQSPVSSNF
ncbi:MAG: DeoR/GlpR family DNA-binding transcription regulator [bacterium]